MLIFDQLKREDRPLWCLTTGILVGLFILLAGLWYLQVVRTKSYVESQKSQSIRKVRLPALRGKICDRNRQVLAENRACYNVNMYLEELSGPFQEDFRQAKGQRKLSRAEREALGRQVQYGVVSNIVRQLGEVLQQPLTNLNEGRFLKHYTNRLALPLPVATNLSSVQIARFLEQPSKLPGLNLDVQTMRYYPYASNAAHVIGQLRRIEKMEEEEAEIDYDYCLPDFIGTVGIEAGFDRDLRGSPGVKALMVNNLGYRQTETNWTIAEAGNDVFLTLDLRIQKAAELALSRVHIADPIVKGAVVVMDPRNGDILALASSPSYNPNAFIPQISTTEWQKLNDPQTWDDPDLKPLINRATQAMYYPGSIFKIVVSLAGLEAGTLDPKEIFHSLGYWPLNAKKYIDDTANSGDFNFYRGFIHSSNPYFITNGLKAGLDNLMNMGQRFCLGQAVNLPLLQEAKGFFPTPNWVRLKKARGDPFGYADLCYMSIGQGPLVTPMQMAVMTAAVANGGQIFWPRLVSKLETREANNRIMVRQYPEAQLRGQLGVQPQNLDCLRAAMFGDVNDFKEKPTGTKAAVKGLNICGKTGTAQVPDDHGKIIRKDVWFVSFAPYENPRYVVVVFVEGGGSGSGTCAPAAREIYEALRKLEGAPTAKSIAWAEDGKAIN